MQERLNASSAFILSWDYNFNYFIHVKRLRLQSEVMHSRACASLNSLTPNWLCIKLYCILYVSEQDHVVKIIGIIHNRREWGNLL
jgi:hypothetical protein